MITLILVGGNSQRFYDAGFALPKVLLPMPFHFTMLDAILSSINPMDDILISARAAMRENWDWPATFRGRRIRYIWAEGAARGPLSGVTDCAELESVKDSLLISYCDVWFPMGAQRIVRHWRGCYSGAVLFRSRDPRYGYWDGHQIHEKRVVGHWAVSGLFYFRSAAECYRRTLENVSLGAGLPSLLDWRTHFYRSSLGELIDLGTPQEYLKFMHDRERAEDVGRPRADSSTGERGEPSPAEMSAP